MKRNLFLILLVLISFIPLVDLLHPGLPITHDGRDHVARIANFYQNLEEGVVVPRWAGNLNWGYGHPILMFLYPLPSYTTSLIHFFGFSFVDSVKIFFGLAFIASGLTMYLWLKEFLPRGGAFVGALLYMFAPYRFIDLYVRGAIGEHAAFVFPPLVLYFMYKLAEGLDSGLRRNDTKESRNDTHLLSSRRRPGSRTVGNTLEMDSWSASRNDKKKNQDDKGAYWYLFGGSLSLAGLILAHNAISLMFMPVIFLYAAYLIWQAKHKKFLVFSSLFLVVCGFALSAFFWLPAFMEGKYTLRDIVTEGSVFDRYVTVAQLFYGPWSYGITGQFSVQVGIIHWILALLSLPVVFLLKKKKDKQWILLSVSLAFFFFTLFLMTPYSQLIWEKITTLQKFQFPWRFLSLSVFLSALIGAIAFSYFLDRLSKKKSLAPSPYTLAPVLFALLILYANNTYWHAKDYSYQPESFYTEIFESTTDTGESAPIWSIRFMEKKPKARMEVIEGQARIAEGMRSSTEHHYTIDVEENATLKENTLYFPGWKIFVDGTPVPIEFQNRQFHGVMTFQAEKGKHDVIVKFEETKLRLLANWVSLASFMVLVGWGILRGKRG